MKRLSASAAVLTLALLVAAPTPARAGSVWDPNDPIRRLDLRWIGSYMQADGRLRVTITFHERVRLRWFERFRYGHLSSMIVPFTQDRGVRPFWWAVFGRRGDGLVAWMCEGGSSCFPGRVTRPSPTSIRGWFPSESFMPGAGWFFRGRTARRGSGELLDRTRWGMVS